MTEAELAAARAAEEAAAIERAKEARRAELRAQISECQSKIGRLNNYKAQLHNEYTESNTMVNTPVLKYDLTTSEGTVSWLGNLQMNGEIKKETARLGVNKFQNGIMNTIGTVDSVIARIQATMEALERELESI